LRIIHSVNSLPLRRLSFCFLENAVVVQLGKLQHYRKCRRLHKWSPAHACDAPRPPWATL